MEYTLPSEAGFDCLIPEYSIGCDVCNWLAPI